MQIEKRKGDRWKLTWRDVKKAAVTAIGSSVIATLGQSFNFNPAVKLPFFSPPTLNQLAITGGAAFAAFSAEMLRRWATDRIKSAETTIQKAEEKRLKKIYKQ